jgi:hypothetical protein
LCFMQIQEQELAPMGRSYELCYESCIAGADRAR